MCCVEDPFCFCVRLADTHQMQPPPFLSSSLWFAQRSLATETFPNLHMPPVIRLRSFLRVAPEHVVCMLASSRDGDLVVVGDDVRGGGEWGVKMPSRGTPLQLSACITEFMRLNEQTSKGTK